MSLSTRSILFKILALAAVIAIVNCADKNDLKSLKRGIILKCQGNPVSCYGKRSGSLPAVNNNLSVDGSDEVEDSNQEKQEVNYELFAETLIRSCKSGNDQSCLKILKMLLMNYQ